MLQVMLGAARPSHNRRMDPRPFVPHAASHPGRWGRSRGIRRLTPLTVPYDRRAEPVGAARARAAAPAIAKATERTLLLTLDDGDWLDVLITTGRDGLVTDTAYLTMADRIVGDEAETIIVLAGVGNEFIQAKDRP
jgi:hypothetical protein